jgi:hypothetical protein
MTLNETIDAYIAAWNETDDAKRAALLQKCWAESATYTDPMADVSGRDGLDGLITGFHGQMPGASIQITSGIDEHHGRIRFGWKLAGGTQALDGIDVGQVDGDGRLLSIIGFWGTNPPAA